MERFAFIALYAPCWPVQQQCRLLGVCPSGYCAWQKRVPVAVVELALDAWQVAAQRIFTPHAGRYDQRRLRAELRREGQAGGRQRLRGWFSANGLRALCTRQLPTSAHYPSRPAGCSRRQQTRHLTHGHRPQSDLGWRHHLPSPGHGPVGLLVRCFSRRVVGWHVSESRHRDLILTAFNRATLVCQPPPRLLVHADRGSQYTSDAFTHLLNRTQAIASLSRPGNPYDNALVESGWSTLKTELLPCEACFADLEKARLELAEYLDHYYNT